MDWENMEILDSARDDYRLRLKEMLYINKLKGAYGRRRNAGPLERKGDGVRNNGGGTATGM